MTTENKPDYVWGTTAQPQPASVEGSGWNMRRALQEGARPENPQPGPRQEPATHSKPAVVKPGSWTPNL